MEIFFEKMKSQMEAQTIAITESVTRTVKESINEELKGIIEENKILKMEIETLKDKMKFMEEDRRRNNLVFFGIQETEDYDGPFAQRIVKMLQTYKFSISLTDINKTHRLGAKSNKIRPVLVSFTTTWKRNEVYKNKNKLPTNIYVKEDFSKEVLEKRKELQPRLEAERAKGKKCFIKRDKLIVIEQKEDQRDKRKRDCMESPSQTLNTAPNKVNKTNMLDYVARSRSTSLTLTRSKNI